jgi:hypothetical protein
MDTRSTGGTGVLQSARKKLWIASVIIVLINVLDLISTYLATPDLLMEWNILVRLLHLGWPGLIGAKLIGVSLAIYGYRYYLMHRTDCYPAYEAGLREFCRFFSFGRSDTTYATGSQRHLWVNIGYIWAGLQLTVAWVTLDNFLLYFTHYYFPLRYHSEWAYQILQGSLVGTLILARLYTSNYYRYRLLFGGVACVALPADAEVASIER